MGERLLDSSVRGLNPSDEAVLVRLVAESMDRGWGRAEIAAGIVAKGARVRLAEVGTPLRPVGFVLARRLADLLEIDLLGVHPGHRRHGVARRLLEALIEEESASDLGEIRLELAASNRAARLLYEGLDFVVVGRRTRYYPDGEDALLLARRLREGRAAS